MENIAEISLDLLEMFIEDVFSILDAKITIPVISSVYKKTTGNDHTILDAFCLVVAVPTTIVFKAIEGKAPFSADDSFSKKLLAAKSLPELQKVYAKSDSESKRGFKIFLHIISCIGSTALAGFAFIKDAIVCKNAHLLKMLLR